MISRHPDSHLDHALTPAQIDYILSLRAPDGEVTVQTVELPEVLGTVPCALYGPLMGDDPVDEAEVKYIRRGARDGESRMVGRPIRQVRSVTVISGPHGDEPCVLYTVYGGPAAPREPFEDSSDETVTFWSKHALSIDLLVPEDDVVVREEDVAFDLDDDDE